MRDLSAVLIVILSCLILFESVIPLGSNILGGDSAILRFAPGACAADQYDETGVASWYGEEFQGRPTASGEPFDMTELTAAHLTLPFGTKVEVTHLENEKSVVVTINDRGPWVEERLIDLSRSAADTLQMVAQGTAKVRVCVVEPQGGSS